MAEDRDESDEDAAQSPDSDVSTRVPDVPEDVVDEAERLTHLARDATDDAEAGAYRDERERLFADYGYETRIREDDGRDVLVAYPEEWLEGGTARPERIDEVDRGVERPLSGVGDPEAWAEVADHNDEVVSAVEADADPVHVANVRALADFASNHYAKPVEDLTREELREFVDEYFPRNAWPTDRQAALIEESVALAFEEVDRRCPLE